MFSVSRPNTGLKGIAQSILLSGTMLTAFASASAAQAQDQAAAPAEPAAEGGITFNEIVVTANRREEAIQDVPVAITAMNAEMLREQNITTAQDLLGMVPSVMIGANGTQRSAETVTIRGQGQTYLAPVGVVNYFAEVPLIQGTIMSNQGAPGSFFDLESLQVLRGPQGTLFGKNTTGGALLLGPKRPTYELGGYVQGQIGNYDDREIEGALNIPLTDRLAIRVAGKYMKRDGFTKDAGPGPFGYVLEHTGPSAGFKGKDYDDKNWWTARVGVLWEPTDNIKNYLVTYYSKSHDNGSGIILDEINPNTLNLANLMANSLYNPAFNPMNPATMFGPQVGQAIEAYMKSLGPRQTALNTDQFSRLSVFSVIDTLDITLNDNLTFRNIFGYQRMKQQYAWDLDGSFLPIMAQLPGFMPEGYEDIAPAGAAMRFSNTSLITEEPQLQGNFLDGRVNLVLGGFYSNHKPEGLEGMGSFNAASYSVGTYFGTKTRSIAIYGQTTIDLDVVSPALDGLSITGGIRNTWDRVRGERVSGNFTVLPVAEAKRSYEEITWNVGLDYKVTDKVLVFGKVTRGYKAGGFNATAPRPEALTYDPEYVTNYEIGAKADFYVADMPVRFNVSAYHLDYSDLQRAAADNYPNGGLNSTGLDQGSITFNAEKARVRGVEIETMIRPTDRLTLSANYSRTEGKYKEFHLDVQADPLVRTVDSCDGPLAVPFTPGQFVRADLSCIPYGYVPKNQFNLNARYEQPLGDNLGTLVGNVNYAWNDKIYHSSTTTPNDDPYVWIDSYGLLNLSVEWNSVMGAPVDARFFMTNVTNKLYRISAYAGYNQAIGFTNSMYGEPRMYGFSLRYRF